MFDTLTLDDLYDLHTKLHDEGHLLHTRFMSMPSVLSENALILQARIAEVSETMRAVYAEIDRRLETQGATTALRELRGYPLGGSGA